MSRPTGVIAGVALFALLSSVARADDTHYRGIPIGAHSIALGGAFVGVADDAAAALYNPAGLTLNQTFGIAGGLSVNAWERFDLDRAYAEPEGAADARVKTSRTVPIFIGAVVKFGPKDLHEARRFALAISVAEPIFSSGGVSVKIAGDPPELTDRYTASTTDRATWYGISFASQINLRHSLGLSWYLSVRKFNQSEVGIGASGGMQLPDSELFVGTSSAANQYNLGMKAFHFVFRLGWLYQFHPQLRFGVMFQPPGVPLKQKANLTSQFIVNDNRDPTMPGRTGLFFLDQQFGANLPLPAELEGGLEYWATEKIMLAFDLSFHGPVRGRDRVEAPADVPLEVAGLFFSPSTERRAIPNAAIGGDFFITDKVAIETGVFTDLSAAPGVPANPTRYYDPQINRFGATLSIAINVAGVSLAVGSTFLLGKGDATGVVVDFENLVQSYTRTEASSRVFYLHITGANRAASDVSEKAARGIQKKRKQKKAAEERRREWEDDNPSEDPG